MKQSSRISALAACASLALMPSAALAQRQPASPEQRIDRLERQVDQLQRQAFPRGRPADTAGFALDPAATQSSVMTLDQRLGAVERQMTDLLRQSEENGHQLQSLQADFAKLRADEDQRVGALEQRVAQAAAPVGPPPPDTAITPPPARPSGRSGKLTASSAPVIPEAVPTDPGTADAAPSDPGEDAYTAGFHQWEGGQYDQAISTLKGFVAAYPKHRRVSYANNLIGRAMLDSGDARGAAAVLLANYRNNPRGERAQDSLFYLGQALMKLGQPSQACNAYAELQSVYGAKVRPDLQKSLGQAKTQAQCS